MIHFEIGFQEKTEPADADELRIQLSNVLSDSGKVSDTIGAHGRARSGTITLLIQVGVPTLILATSRIIRDYVRLHRVSVTVKNKKGDHIEIHGQGDQLIELGEIVSFLKDDEG